MIAIDTNILVYAHREESPFHRSAQAVLATLHRKGTAWAVPWSCVHEFFGVITSQRLFKGPTPVDVALRTIDSLLNADGLVLVGETDRHWDVLRALIADARISGAMVHDARIAAICLQHGVRELWSADRDFTRFPALKVVNPLVG